VTVVRGFQLFIAFIILILSGHIIHGLALDAVCFSLACVSSFFPFPGTTGSAVPSPRNHSSSQ
jgi:hypothetical protein